MHTHGIHGSNPLAAFLPLAPKEAQGKTEFVLDPSLEQVDPDGSRGQADEDAREQKRRSEETSEKAETVAETAPLPPPSSTPLTVYNRAGVFQSHPLAGGQIRTSG